jgi:hypothetical protein
LKNIKDLTQSLGNHSLQCNARKSHSLVLNL